MTNYQNSQQDKNTRPTGYSMRTAQKSESAAENDKNNKRSSAENKARPTAQGGGNKRTIFIVIACVIIALVVWLCVWLFACNGNSLFDPNAQTGQAPYKSEEEMQAELDRVVEEGMFNISIASVIEFADGTSSGTAYIENVPGNRYNMQVTITDDNSGDVLYESGVLQPNQFIESIVLVKDLEAGTYPATATFTALDPTTYDQVGQAAAKITLNVAG
ncbi:flagellar protein FliS [Adlercreutzia sp. ZJ304]|uniref:flagellar protein FliS n=1 Tax=Adlercreutzia sp. ZJ304 TaxID=2709791 RepID=UPI0013EC8429|nr:flagellar protein FliS [Adlercreutzia sp. ZJ304]